MAVESLEEKITKASTLVSNNHFDEATLIFDEILISPPKTLAGCIHFGRFCAQLGKLDYSIEFLTRATEIEPENAIAHGFLGAAYLETNQLQEAETRLRKSISLNDTLIDPLLNLSTVLINSNRYAEAAEYLAKAIAVKPSEAKIYADLAICNGELGHYQEAIEYGEKAIKLNSGNVSAFLYLGRVYSVLGQPDTATKYYEKAIKLNKTLGQAYEGISKVRKYSESDRALINKFKKALTQSMPAIDRSHINFAIGKMLDDCDDWEEAFKFYHQANLLMKKTNDYTPPHIITNAMKKVFTSDFLKKVESGDNSDVTPVFIVGMPRSGTTLIEQIIASHPQAKGAGELKDIGVYSEEIFANDDYTSIQHIISQGLNSDIRHQYIDRYMQVLRNGRDSSDCITNKTPDNYICLGLIRWLFPEAKIIHSIRNPLDTCLSCYFQAFTEVEWSFDLEWISKRYKFYRETMAHWKSVLPEGAILDIEYESLVEDPESNIREIIEFCGLEWDPACLDFSKTKRVVTTASLSQVRQPVYKTSKLRFKNYATHLKDLAKSLSKYLQQDKAMLKDCGLKLKPSWWPGS